jgi:hypothetical protein
MRMGRLLHLIVAHGLVDTNPMRNLNQSDGQVLDRGGAVSQLFGLPGGNE